MKNCLVCSKVNDAAAASCSACGEGSWSSSAPAQSSVAAPPSRSDRRAARKSSAPAQESADAPSEPKAEG